MSKRVFSLSALALVTGCALGAPAAGDEPDSPPDQKRSTAQEPASPTGSEAAPAAPAAPVVSADACASEVVPAVLEGTSPIHPAINDNAGRPISFPCLGACGASCDLMNKTEHDVDVCLAGTCRPGKHRIARYHQITGASHTFCTWHDSCYLECSKAFENDDKDRYELCARWCDFGCVSPNNWSRSRDAGDYSPSFWDRTVMGGLVFQMTGDDDDRRRSIATTRPAGAVPPKTWVDADCAGWGLTGFLGSNVATDLVASEGTIAFTELVSVGDWVDGGCPATAR
jgi:hypothetical protein